MNRTRTPAVHAEDRTRCEEEGMPTLVHGLPAHVLLVHVVVVLVPVAALMVLAAAWWPAARRRLGMAPMVASALALVAVPVTTSAGHWLEARVARTPAVLHHAHLGGTLWPWVTALLVVAVAGWLVARRETPGPEPTDTERRTSWVKAVTGAAALPLVVAVVATAVAAGSVVQVYRIGDSGATAVWLHNFSHTPVPDLRPVPQQ